MKKSDKKFKVHVTSAVGTGTDTNIGTRSGVANFTRELLDDVKPGDVITLKIQVEAADEPAAEAPKA